MKPFQHLAQATVGVVLLFAAAALAVPTPETSLNTCQEKVRTEGKKFVQNTVNAAGICLKAVAVDLIKNNGAISATTSKTCVSQFRKFNDTRANDQSIEEKFKQNVDKKCEPGFSPSVTHTLNDMTAHAGGGVTEKIKTVNSDTWCKHFGGDGSVDSLAEWEDCLVASFHCQTALAIASAFPRSAEWLTSLIAGPNMPSVPPPGSDPTKTTDAVSGASDLRDLIDPDGDGIPSPLCGGEGVACATACCYIENTAPNGIETSCVQYTGPAGAIGAFMAACPTTTSIPAVGGPGAQVHTAIPIPCAAAPSPVNGLPCLPAPLNTLIMPTDSSCP